jgi:capsular exopolysaccharide synthesis family protein
MSDYAERGLDLLQRRKWTVLLVFVLVLSGVVGYTYSQTPLYRASSLVLISGEGERQNASPSYGPNEPFARADRSLRNEILILRNSQKLQEGVAKRILEQKTIPGTGRPISLLAADSLEPTVESVAAGIQGYVQFTPAGREADVIQITAHSQFPREAALLSNLYLREYLELTQEASRSRLTASREFLEAQADKRKKDLQAIEQRIQAYKSQKGAVALDQEGEYLVNRIAQVEADRDEARVKLRMREASLESLQKELAAISPEQLSRRVGSAIEQEIEALHSTIADLELSRKQLLLQSGGRAAADSAQVRQISDRIRQLRSEADSLSRTYVDEVMAAGGLSAGEGVSRVKELQRKIAEERIDITGLEARIAVLSDRLQEYDRELRTLPEQSMELAQLERSRTYAERMYQFVVEQLQQTRIQEESKQGYANSITEATIPVRPVQPQTQRNVILGLIFGLLLGFGTAVARDKLDNRLYKPDELRDKGLRTIGVIPNLMPFIRKQLGGRETVEEGGHALSSHLVAHVHPNSAAAEAYRHVRTNIQFGRPDKVVETLLITSPGAGDGKSVSAANIAVTMAQADRRTLLIDADLHRPQVHQLFDVPRTPGLADVLQDERDGMVDITSTVVDNLYVLPAGSSVSDPSQLLGSAALREFLRRADEHFDMIVLDTPPVLAATDAALLSTQCDASILVARAGESTEHEIDHAMDVLDDVGAGVIGTLFNGFDLSMAYGYTLRYRHYTRYGPYDQYGTSAGPSVQA